MEQKLELKDIAGYLDYDLNLFNKRTGIIGQYQHPYLAISNDIVKNNRITLIPVLYPINAIYKPMVHNGKEIIPIVELAHIGSYFNSEVNWQQEGLCAILGNWHFYYESFIRGFVLENNNTFRIVYNQYQLFDYLHELKIDYRGLIDAKLAVSVYDLDTNPYK